MGLSASSQKNRPFFSILVPSYNRPEYITKCIDSILGNDFHDYEIIISDDKSPRGDEIEQSLEAYLKNENILFFRQPQNLREPGNKNFLVSRAKGKYTIFIGDDDTFYSHTLSKLKRYIEEYPDYDLYGFGYAVMDEHDTFMYARHAPKKVEVTLSNPKLMEHLFLSDLFPFWLYHPATFCCKSEVEKWFPYSLDAGIGEDFLFVFDIINAGKKMMVIPESLFRWRKIQSKGDGYQRNQSLLDMSGVRARRNIYYHLQNRKDLHDSIRALISGFEYRQKFLYNPAFLDKAVNVDGIHSLALDKEHVGEFNAYCAEANHYIVFIMSYINRTIDFVELFGLRGLLEVLKVFLERLGYIVARGFRSKRSAPSQAKGGRL